MPARPLEGLLVVLVDLVVNDLQDFDEAGGGPQPAQGRLLVGIQLGHGPSRLPPRRLVASSPKVQIDSVALELELIDLALTVVLAAGLEGEQLRIAG